MILEPWTAEVWQRVWDAGKFTKAHAGEFMGPDFVWKAIDELKVTRLEDGVRAVEVPALVERLVWDRIGLDPGPLCSGSYSGSEEPGRGA